MRFNIIHLSTGLLISTLLVGQVAKNTEELLIGEVSEAINNTTTSITKGQKDHSIALIKNSPFIPFKASKDNISSVESSDLEFLSVVDYATSKYSFCLKDKQSGKRFWIHSDGSDNNMYGIIFYQYNPVEKLLIVQNDEGEIVSMQQQKPKLNESTGAGSWSNDAYSELLRSLDDDDDED